MNACHTVDVTSPAGSPALRRTRTAWLAGWVALAGLLVTSPTGRGPAFDDTLPDWIQQGRVSWYGPGFHGRRTANGEIFDTHELTMAHRSLAFGSAVRVTNLETGRSVVLRVNARGPSVRGRVADLSQEDSRRWLAIRESTSQASSVRPASSASSSSLA